MTSSEPLLILNAKWDLFVAYRTYQCAASNNSVYHQN
jgi:hypothetical protein